MESRDPLLSVIVPVYNVEDYLAECLESLLQQTYTELEIVLVDDGSTDGSALICRQYAERDSRVRWVRQENAGLGAARNRGVAESTGSFLTFVDSDDTVPSDAYARMMRVLLRSGSDFVVGAISRQVEDRYVEPGWARRLHSRRQVGVTVEDVPDVLANIFACNKVFRRSFWERAELEFPTGVRYEDQLPITKAYLRSDRFDMVSAVVYRWRTRQDGTSITQRRSELRDLHDRLEAKRLTARLVASYPSEVVRRSWFAKVLRYDLDSYYRAALAAGDDYWNDLVSGLRELLEATADDVWTAIPAQHRLSAHLVARGRRDDYAVLARFLDRNTHGFPVRELAGRRVLALPFVEECGSSLPAHCFELHGVDTELKSRLLGLGWRSDGTVAIRGAAFLRHLGSAEGPSTIRLALVERHTGVSMDLAVGRWESAELNIWAARTHQDHSDSGFETSVDVDRLVQASQGLSDAAWDLTVSVQVDDFHQTGSLQTRAAHASATDIPPSVRGSVLVRPRWLGKLGVSFQVLGEHVTLVGVDAGGDSLEFEVAGSSSQVQELLVERTGWAELRSVGRRTGASTTRHTVPLKAVVASETPCDVRARLSSGAVVPVYALSSDTPALWQGTVPGAAYASVRRRLDGTVVAGADPVAVIDQIDCTGDDVTIRGTLPGIPDVAFWLRGPRASTPAVSAEIGEGRFVATIKARSHSFGEADLLVQDIYAVCMTSSAGVGAVVASQTLRDSLPASHDVGWGRWDLEVDHDGRLALKRGHAWNGAENSQFGQHLLQRGIYEAARSGPRRPVVLFECFNGKTLGDSPWAIFEHLRTHGYPYTFVWSVSDSAVRVPEDTRAVVRNTAEWYDVLGSAAFIVSNNNFPAFFAKADEQVHLQTWHGTPLKKIGHDIAAIQFGNGSYLDIMDAEAARWDYLLSPSPYCTEIFPRAFAFSGEILELGYPRNDVLVQDSSGELRTRVRRTLGIRPDQRVVLYAPTWRDTVKAGATYDKVLFLDPMQVTSQLDDVVVLVRGHSNTAARPSVEIEGADRVIDVTLYPDVAHLFLAADLLVTDYSSVMFDFAITRKPILFLVPDLESYRDQTRGFYFSLEDEAPGPLLTSTDEVVAWLRDPLAHDHREAVEAFVHKFAPLDDGHATERVVDAVFGASAVGVEPRSGHGEG